MVSPTLAALARCIDAGSMQETRCDPTWTPHLGTEEAVKVTEELFFIKRAVSSPVAKKLVAFTLGSVKAW